MSPPQSAGSYPIHNVPVMTSPVGSYPIHQGHYPYHAYPVYSSSSTGGPYPVNSLPSGGITTTDRTHGSGPNVTATSVSGVNSDNTYQSNEAARREAESRRTRTFVHKGSVYTVDGKGTLITVAPQQQAVPSSSAGTGSGTGTTARETQPARSQPVSIGSAPARAYAAAPVARSQSVSEHRKVQAATRVSVAPAAPRSGPASAPDLVMEAPVMLEQGVQSNELPRPANNRFLWWVKLTGLMSFACVCLVGALTHMVNRKSGTHYPWWQVLPATVGLAHLAPVPEAPTSLLAPTFVPRSSGFPVQTQSDDARKALDDALSDIRKGL